MKFVMKDKGKSAEDAGFVALPEKITLNNKAN